MKGGMRYLGFGLLAVAAIAGLGVVVMLLWNAVVPGVITVAHPIDYAQALGLLLLSRILFGGFRGRPGFRRAGRWTQWQAMTPEERTRMRESAGSRGCR